MKNTETVTITMEEREDGLVILLSKNPSLQETGTTHLSILGEIAVGAVRNALLLQGQRPTREYKDGCQAVSGVSIQREGI